MHRQAGHQHVALCSRTEGGRITLDSSQVCAATMQLFQHCFWAYKRSRRLRSRLGTGPLRILGFCVLLLGAREVCTSGAPPFLFAALPQSIMKIMDDVDRQRFGFMSRDWKMLRIHASSENLHVQHGPSVPKERTPLFMQVTLIQRWIPCRGGSLMQHH